MRFADFIIEEMNRRNISEKELQRRMNMTPENIQEMLEEDKDFDIEVIAPKLGAIMPPTQPQNKGKLIANRGFATVYWKNVHQLVRNSEKLMQNNGTHADNP
jgi:hypothetical protein